MMLEEKRDKDFGLYALEEYHDNRLPPQCHIMDDVC